MPKVRTFPASHNTGAGQLDFFHLLASPHKNQTLKQLQCFRRSRRTRPFRKPASCRITGNGREGK